MFKQKPFLFSFVILAVLLIFHIISSNLSLYWSYPWLDIFTHMLSGLWVALVFLWLASVFGQINSLKEYRTKSFLIAFISAIFIGVLWELVENFSQITFVNANGYGLGTALDILSDGLGGILAYLYFVRRTKCLNNIDKPVVEAVHPFYSQTGLIKAN